jgi:hypothetical protein
MNYAHKIAKKIPSRKRRDSAPGGNRTRTRVAANRILSPACLPVPPPGHGVKKIPNKARDLERKTGLEPATPTLARSCSTK